MPHRESCGRSWRLLDAVFRHATGRSWPRVVADGFEYGVRCTGVALVWHRKRIWEFILLPSWP